MTGVGNLIVGYNGSDSSDLRTGSHNLVVGDKHSYNGHSSIMVGSENDAHGNFIAVVGGIKNTVSEDNGAILGGDQNRSARRAESRSAASPTRRAGSTPPSPAASPSRLGWRFTRWPEQHRLGDPQRHRRRHQQQASGAHSATLVAERSLPTASSSRPWVETPTSPPDRSAWSSVVWTSSRAPQRRPPRR